MVLTSTKIAPALLLFAFVASGAAEAQVPRRDAQFWYKGGYSNPARGSWSQGRFFPNTHDPRRFINAPGVVVSH